MIPLPDRRVPRKTNKQVHLISRRTYLKWGLNVSFVPHVVNRVARQKDRIRRKHLLHSGVVCGIIRVV